MIHNEIEIISGKYQLRKMTKTQVKKIIQNNNKFHGFICGNKVNPVHIAEGWHLGAEIDMNDTDEFEKYVKSFETGLVIYTPGLGQYAHYYQIVDSSDEKELTNHVTNI